MTTAPLRTAEKTLLVMIFLTLLSPLSVVFVNGCDAPQKSEALRDTVLHSWTFREKLIYRNENLTRAQKVNEIHMLGAALDMAPDEIVADLQSHLPAE